MTEQNITIPTSTDEAFGIELALYGLAEAIKDKVPATRFLESFRQTVADLANLLEADRAAAYGRLLSLLDSQAESSAEAIKWEIARHDAALKMANVVRDAIFDHYTKTQRTTYPIGDTAALPYKVRHVEQVAYMPDFDPATLPDAYRRFRLPMFVGDEAAIREALERGEKIEGAALVPAMTVIRR